MHMRTTVLSTLLAVACMVVPNSHSAVANSGLDLAGMDKMAAPGDSFNQYVSGAWAKATEIPADKSSVSPGSDLSDKTRKQIVDLISDLAKKKNPSGSSAQKVGDYYAAYMDENTIEARGLTPLKSQFAAIASIADRKQLSTEIGRTLRADVDALNNTDFYTENLFGFWITQGLDDPNHIYAYLLQGGLGLPDRDYYVSTSPKMADLRERYHAHLAATFKLAGLPDEAARAERVFALEMKMAQAHATRTESEDVHLAARWQRADLDAKAPGLDWNALLAAAEMKDLKTLYVWHQKAITGLSKLAASEPLDSWKDWLTFHAINHNAHFLPKAIAEENFSFYGRTLTGALQDRPRWQNGADETSGALGDDLGKLYVERHFPAETKKQVQSMVSDLKKAFAKRIDKLTWMSPETKAKAKDKLRTLKVGVGYPDKWEMDRKLKISRDDAFGNRERAELSRYHQQLAKLHKKPDQGEWWMPPQLVNAVNLPLQNALNFPAAILQPPYFDATADAAHNYGSLGAIIGHEISHSFDDQGSLFDAQGRFINWWTKDDFAHFEAAGHALAAQYDQYKPFPDLAINGHQTLSENIADLAGLATAYDAYQISLGGKPAPVLDGFTGDQRFFISYGQSWRSKTREAKMRMQIATDGHAPAEYRSETVRNLDAWYDAFAVKPDQKLYLKPEARVRVW